MATLILVWRPSVLWACRPLVVVARRFTAAAASYELVRFGAVLEVREHAAELEQVEDLAVERALSLVLEMMDRKRRAPVTPAPAHRFRGWNIVSLR